MTDADTTDILDEDRLHDLQLARLSDTLARVARSVPHYGRAFAAAGVTPGDLRTLDDLSRFPFTGKAELRENYPFGMFAVPREQVVRVHASSGTTGAPTVVGYTRGDIDIWADVVARCIRVAGGRAGDVLHNAYGYGLFTGGLGAHYGAERLGCTVVPVSGGMTERQIRLIQDFGPRIIMMTPSYALALIDELERSGLDPRATSLEIGIFGAEPWTEEMRGEIEERLGITALDIYGLSEVIGPGVAQERADAKGALQLWEDHFLPEIIDPDTGAVLADGEWGELVITSLTREAMPVIRYRTRDITRLIPGEGSPMRRMEKVRGRTDDMVIVRGVNVFPSQIEELILRLPELSPHYLCELARRGRLDTLTVHVERRREVSSAAADEAGAALAGLVKNTVGVTVEVVVAGPGSIERSQGKQVRVRDLR